MSGFEDIGAEVEEWLQKEIDDIKSRFDEVGAYLVDTIQNAYEAQEMEGPPLAEVTVRKKGSDIKLIDTGAMVDSFHYEIEDDVLWVGSDYGVDTLDIPLCEVHENGTGSIPARPLLKALFEAEEDHVMDMLAGEEENE